ncbi:hypothetical protein L7F22_027144 [Adiantum nelumboides]|nr:hypothetical protein [Adiantum nelumboides]
MWQPYRDSTAVMMWQLYRSCEETGWSLPAYLTNSSFNLGWFQKLHPVSYYIWASMSYVHGSLWFALVFVLNSFKQERNTVHRHLLRGADTSSSGDALLKCGVADFKCSGSCCHLSPLVSTASRLHLIDQELLVYFLPPYNRNSSGKFSQKQENKLRKVHSLFTLNVNYHFLPPCIKR